MFGFFKLKPLLSKNSLDFEIASFRWLLSHLNVIEFYNIHQLVLPNEKFFPIKMGEQSDIAKETFERVKEYANMKQWSTTLEVQESDINPILSDNIMIKNVEDSALGTFYQDHNYHAIISYNPSIVDEPMKLIATFAHELSHYRIRDTGATPPGGWENEEYLTDITATFLGFGIFMANSTFNTSTDANWWKASYSGYLSETEHIYALAIFLEFQKRETKEAIEFLKPHLKKILKKAVKEIRRDKIIERILAKEKPSKRRKRELQKYEKWRK
jgi:hypothetical protein